MAVDIVTPPMRQTSRTTTTADAASPVLTLVGTHNHSCAAIVAADEAAVTAAIVQHRWRRRIMVGKSRGRCAVGRCGAG